MHTITTLWVTVTDILPLHQIFLKYPKIKGKEKDCEPDEIEIF